MLGLLFDLVHMNVLLRERNRDAVLIELFLHLLGEIIEHGPVVARLRPWPTDKIHRRIGQLTDFHNGSRILQDERMAGDHGRQDFLDLLQIVVVTTTKHHIDPTRVVRRHVAIEVRKCRPSDRTCMW